MIPNLRAEAFTSSSPNVSLIRRHQVAKRQGSLPLEVQVLIEVPGHCVENGAASRDGLFCRSLFGGDGREVSDVVSAGEAGVGAVP